jgi:hypothetical protein
VVVEFLPVVVLLLPVVVELLPVVVEFGQREALLERVLRAAAVHVTEVAVVVDLGQRLRFHQQWRTAAVAVVGPSGM